MKLDKQILLKMQFKKISEQFIKVYIAKGHSGYEFKVLKEFISDENNMMDELWEIVWDKKLRCFRLYLYREKGNKKEYRYIWNFLITKIKDKPSYYIDMRINMKGADLVCTLQDISMFLDLQK